jgi:hypothetical protein
MSWDWVGPVMRLNLDLTSRMVLVVYANETNSDGEQIGISVEKAALLCGTTDRTVQKYVKAYQRLGVLVETTEQVGRGRTRVWRLNYDRAARLFGKIPTFRELRALKEKGESPAPFKNPTKGEFEVGKGEPGALKGEPGAPTPIETPIETPARSAAAAGAEGAADGPRKAAALPPWSLPWRGVREFWRDRGWSDAKIDGWESDLYRWATNELSLTWPHAKLVMWWALKTVHAQGPTEAKITARAMALLKGGRGGDLLAQAQAEADRHDAHLEAAS